MQKSYETIAKDVYKRQEMLRIILEDEKLIVKDVIVQSSKRNLYGRSVRLDALCIPVSYTHLDVYKRQANITLSDLALLKEDAVPEDAAALIINGPTTDFSEDDANKVIDYINQGGKVLITCNFQAQGLENFESILSACGMERVSGIVMENDKSYYYSNTPYYLLPDVNSSAYTSSVSGSYIFAPYSEAITYGAVSYTHLLFRQICKDRFSGK